MMNKLVLKRIIANIILFVCILFAPWWLTIIFSIIFLFYFLDYYELIIAALFVDIIYGTPQNWIFDLPLMYTVFSLVVFVFVRWLKFRLR